MVAKAGLGIIGLGAISIGGVAFTKPEWLGINKETPWTPLAKDSDYKDSGDNDIYKDKFGSTHKYYLVGADEGNKRWWEETFEKLKEDSAVEASKQPSEDFKHTSSNSKVDAGFAKSEKDGGDKALNQICKKIYKSEASSVDATGTGENKYKEADVWKYCSPLGEKPKTIDDVDKPKSLYQTGNAIGKTDEDRKKLISIKGNDKFWTIREKEFKGYDGHDKIEKGTSEDAFFSITKGKTIKELCEEAYGLDAAATTSEANKPTKNQTIKYCSLGKS